MKLPVSTFVRLKFLLLSFGFFIIPITTALSMGNKQHHSQEIRNFVNFCTYRAKDFKQIEEKFHKLFKKDDNIKEFEELTIGAKLKKGDVSSQHTKSNNENLVWFGKDCDNGTSWGMVFVIDPNNKIVSKDITLQISSDKFLSHNIPFSFQYFASAKRIKEILSHIFKHRRIDDLDNFMLSAGAKKINEQDSDKFNSTKKLSYKYCFENNLFFDYIGNVSCYDIDLYINAKKEVVNISSRSSFFPKQKNKE